MAAKTWTIAALIPVGDLVNQRLNQLQDSVLNLHAHFNVLRWLGVQVNSKQVAQTQTCLSWTHILPDKCGDLPQSLSCIDTFGYQKVEEIRVIDVLWTTVRQDTVAIARSSVAIELVELMLKQVNLVLAAHDIIAFLCLLFSLGRHRSKVVVDHVEQAWVLLWCRL